MKRPMKTANGTGITASQGRLLTHYFANNQTKQCYWQNNECPIASERNAIEKRTIVTQEQCKKVQGQSKEEIKSDGDECEEERSVLHA